MACPPGQIEWERISNGRRVCRAASLPTPNLSRWRRVTPPAPPDDPVVPPPAAPPFREVLPEGLRTTAPVVPRFETQPPGFTSFAPSFLTPPAAAQPTLTPRTPSNSRFGVPDPLFGLGISGEGGQFFFAPVRLDSQTIFDVLVAIVRGGEAFFGGGGPGSPPLVFNPGGLPSPSPR